MNTLRLVYCSRAAGHVGNLDLMQILEVSRDNNAKDGITGALGLTRTHFFQLLEGDPSLVRRLLRRICSDSRHFEVNVVGNWMVENRLFGNWWMLWLEERAIKAWEGAGHFQPQDLPADRLVDMIVKSAGITFRADAPAPIPLPLPPVVAPRAGLAATGAERPVD